MYGILYRTLLQALDRVWYGAKLAGAVRLHALRVDPQSMEDLEKRWKQDDRTL
jgi:hypothetical protein